MYNKRVLILIILFSSKLSVCSKGSSFRKCKAKTSQRLINTSVLSFFKRDSIITHFFIFIKGNINTVNNLNTLQKNLQPVYLINKQVTTEVNQLPLLS